MSIFDKETWEDRRDGERAYRDGHSRYENPYRDSYDYEAEQHQRSWDRGFDAERDRREEERAEEERHVRHLEERRRQEAAEQEALEWDAYQRAAPDAEAAAAYEAEIEAAMAESDAAARAEERHRSEGGGE